jgi:hypothetical protein
MSCSSSAKCSNTNSDSIWGLKIYLVTVLQNLLRKLLSMNFAKFQQETFYDLKLIQNWYQVFCRTLTIYVLWPQIESKLISSILPNILGHKICLVLVLQSVVIPILTRFEVLKFILWLFCKICWDQPLLLLLNP